MKYSNSERGYTMIETIMYIGILIVLGGVLASYAHKAIARYKIGRTVQQVVELKKAILHFTAADEDYRNISVKNMDEHHSLPLDMRTGDTSKAVHALGGSIEIGPMTEVPLNVDEDDPNAYHMFFIKFDGLDKHACLEILTQGQFYGDGSELDTLIVNGTKAWQFEYSFYDTERYGNNGVPKQEFSSKCVEGSEDDENCVKQVSNRITIGEALAVCTKEKSQNFIIWVFS